ncbi:non-heme iron oxygenase ferredoxin subunit [Thermochromatium tepidum]|jgi:Ferredoxin subunits of nitrite reductase and ring-hydroxylating dioxygenases|uniref:Rieske 2Fe-2S domain-containing protein n=1 Tax=Thermochromatium tepidum ATCC 43061 TaxID=316276 RepID=A0A6I6E1E1_THETI|nr:non-heme iron oxygenase ferredoxin subunit [Thermochromatium tepidum]QGU33694.1 Rieske 2Fe-2S domain-containing protein [Thermochromatium tepidum ATCC 43061]
MSDSFVAVAACDTIPDGKFIKVRVAGRALVLAHVAGRYYAVEDQCSHEDYPLSFGCLDGDRIKCSLHGSRFSLETGAPLEEPADRPIRVFPVKVMDGWVWIDPST